MGWLGSRHIIHVGLGGSAQRKRRRSQKWLATFLPTWQGHPWPHGQYSRNQEEELFWGSTEKELPWDDILVRRFEVIWLAPSGCPVKALGSWRSGFELMGPELSKGPKLKMKRLEHLERVKLSPGQQIYLWRKNSKEWAYLKYQGKNKMEQNAPERMF